MIDHIGIKVSDFDQARTFYSAALAPLGYTVLMEPAPGFAGFGRDGKPDFWIQPGPTSGSCHIAFAARDHATVDAFYKAALAAGATDNGAPGARPQYHPGYYGAFVIGPDGHNLEAVCHHPM